MGPTVSRWCFYLCSRRLVSLVPQPRQPKLLASLFVQFNDAGHCVFGERSLRLTQHLTLKGSSVFWSGMACLESILKAKIEFLWRIPAVIKPHWQGVDRTSVFVEC